MTELEALRRVAEAARGLVRWPDAVTDGGAVVSARALYLVFAALDALDALPSSPASEPQGAVEVRAKVWLWPNSTEFIVTADHIDLQYPLAAILTAHVPLPEVPTVAATVTLPLDREVGR